MAHPFVQVLDIVRFRCFDLDIVGLGALIERAVAIERGCRVDDGGRRIGCSNDVRVT